MNALLPYETYLCHWRRPLASGLHLHHNRSEQVELILNPSPARSGHYL